MINNKTISEGWTETILGSISEVQT